MWTTVLAVGLTGCGTRSESLDAESPSAPEVVLFGECSVDDPQLESGDVVAEADIEGSGPPEEITYIRDDAGGSCANALYTTLDGEAVAMPLGDARIDEDSFEVIQLVGTERQLLVAREEPHPRGGYQVHVYGFADGVLSELLVDGEPLVGFVATDGGAAPTTAVCTDDGGLATLSAVPHVPPGIVLAWDVTRTTYSLSGNVLKEVASELIREAAADPLLRAEMPQLFDPAGYFDDCIIPDGPAD